MKMTGGRNRVTITEDEAGMWLESCSAVSAPSSLYWCLLKLHETKTAANGIVSPLEAEAGEGAPPSTTPGRLVSRAPTRDRQTGVGTMPVDDTELVDCDG